MLAMLATEIRLERHSVRVIIDTRIVLSEPRHTDDERVRKGGDVQGNSLFVPRYADSREVVVRYWAGRDWLLLAIIMMVGEDFSLWVVRTSSESSLRMQLP